MVVGTLVNFAYGIIHINVRLIQIVIGDIIAEDNAPPVDFWWILLHKASICAPFASLRDRPSTIIH